MVIQIQMLAAEWSRKVSVQVTLERLSYDVILPIYLIVS